MILSRLWPRAYALIGRAATLALLWAALTNNAGWHFGVATVIAATLAGQIFAPLRPSPWSPIGLGWFLVYFFIGSLRGGIDVAYRALHPDLPVQPSWLHYPLRLPKGPGQVLFACAVNLQPGTLSADLQDDDLTIHLLLERPDTKARLNTLEERVAAVFSITLSSRSTKEADYD